MISQKRKRNHPITIQPKIPKRKPLMKNIASGEAVTIRPQQQPQLPPPEVLQCVCKEVIGEKDLESILCCKHCLVWFHARCCFHTNKEKKRHEFICQSCKSLASVPVVTDHQAQIKSDQDRALEKEELLHPSGDSVSAERVKMETELPARLKVKSPTDSVIVLERGRLHFWYRPKNGVLKPEGLNDVQKLYFIMHPSPPVRYDKKEPKSPQKLFRMIIVPSKRLPKLETHGSPWCFVDQVGDTIEEFHSTMEHSEDGWSHSMRPCGEMYYAFIRTPDSKSPLYSSYRLLTFLQTPGIPGPVQRALGIQQEACYIVTAKNPEKSPTQNAIEQGTPGLSERKKAHYPPELQNQFLSKYRPSYSRRWAAVDTDFLNYEGAEFLLIGTRHEYPELTKLLRMESEQDQLHAEHTYAPDYPSIPHQKMFAELHLDESKFHVESLDDTTWV